MTVKKLFKQVITSRNAYLEIDGRNYRVYFVGDRYNIICVSGENEFKHYLTLLKQVKEKFGFKANRRNILDVYNCFSMALSIACYCSRDIETILNSRYIREQDLAEPYRETVVSYVLNSIDNIKRGVGEDSEGNSYNSVELVAL